MATRASVEEAITDVRNLLNIANQEAASARRAAAVSQHALEEAERRLTELLASGTLKSMPSSSPDPPSAGPESNSSATAEAISEGWPQLSIGEERVSEQFSPLHALRPKQPPTAAHTRTLFPNRYV